MNTSFNHVLRELVHGLNVLVRIYTRTSPAGVSVATQAAEVKGQTRFQSYDGKSINIVWTAIKHCNIS